MNALLTVIGWLDLGSTSIFAGGVISAALIGRPGAAGERALRIAAVLLGATLLAEFVVTVIRMRAVASVDGVALIRSVLATRWGELWVVRAGGLLMLGRVRFSAPSGAVLAALWLLARSFQGHAGAHGTLPAVIDWLHLLAAVTWLGSLAQFALLPDPLSREVAHRVRSVGTGSLMVLVPAGIYGALLHIPSLGALLETPYGRALSGKLILASLLIALGTANHFRYVPALQRGDSSAGPALSRVVRFELIVALFVLLLSSLLTVLPMPHAMP